MASSLASLHVVAVVIKIFVSSIVAHLLLLLKSKNLPAHGAGAVPEEGEEFKRSASQIMRSFQPWQPAFKAGRAASMESWCVTSREQQLQKETFIWGLLWWFELLWQGYSSTFWFSFEAFISVLNIDVQSTHWMITCWPTWKGSIQMGQLLLVDSSTVRVSRAWYIGQIWKWWFRFELRRVQWLAKGDLDVCKRHRGRPHLVFSLLGNDFTLRHFWLNVEKQAHNPDTEWGDEIHLAQLSVAQLSGHPVPQIRQISRWQSVYPGLNFVPVTHTIW